MKTLLFLWLLTANPQGFQNLAGLKKERRVYVCDSPYAYAYHFSEDCKGLQNCRRRIVETSLDSALNVFGKKKKCYLEK